MALQYAHGAVQWLAADPATTKYSITGLGFTTKAIRCYWTGIQSATDATSSTSHIRRGIGFAVSPSARRCVQATSLDNAATSDCTSSAFDNRIASVLNAAQNATGALDLDAINSDGFDLIVDVATGIDVTVFWEAWGGDDITVAVVGDAPEPAAIGNQDYTVTGFVAGAIDQVVMFAGVYSTAALNSTVGSDSSFCIGFATSGDAADNISCGGSSDDGSPAMDTEGWGLDGECLSKTIAGGGSVNARAQLTQFNTDGFRLNWISRAVSDRRNIWMAIKGGNWKAGSYVIDSGTIGNTQTVSGLSFQPIGGCLMGRAGSETAAGVVADHDRVALGSFSSSTSRRSMSWWDAHATASSISEINLGIEYDQALDFVGTSGPTFDISAINSDGFTTIVDDGSNGSATEWHGYLTFGSVPGQKSFNVYNISQAVNRASTY